MYTSTQTHSHKVVGHLQCGTPRKAELKEPEEHETPRTHSQGLSGFTKRCSSKGTTTSTKVTKRTLQSMGVEEVLVILEVSSKDVSINARKSAVKIASL